MKPKRANGELSKFNGSRIVEVDDESDETAGLGIIGNVPNLDMKYELFCKWLQQNGQNSMLHSDREQNSSTLLTEDEVSSFATNSDDSSSDVFLDTESDFPIIVLSNDNDEIVPLNSDNVCKLNGMNSPFRVDTPSQLSVSDFDCSSSDITVSSRVSGTSSQIARRKAKHNKGRAPSVPTNKSISSENNESTNIEVIANPAIQNDIPPTTRSARETDI